MKGKEDQDTGNFAFEQEDKKEHSHRQESKPEIENPNSKRESEDLKFETLPFTREEPDLRMK